MNIDIAAHSSGFLLLHNKLIIISSFPSARVVLLFPQTQLPVSCQWPRVNVWRNAAILPHLHLESVFCATNAANGRASVSSYNGFLLLFNFFFNGRKKHPHTSAPSPYTPQLSANTARTSRHAWWRKTCRKRLREKEKKRARSRRSARMTYTSRTGTNCGSFEEELVGFSCFSFLSRGREQLSFLFFFCYSFSPSLLRVKLHNVAVVFHRRICRVLHDAKSRSKSCGSASQSGNEV